MINQNLNPHVFSSKAWAIQNSMILNLPYKKPVELVKFYRCNYGDALYQIHIQNFLKSGWPYARVIANEATKNLVAAKPRNWDFLKGWLEPYVKHQIEQPQTEQTGNRVADSSPKWTSFTEQTLEQTKLQPL